MYKEESNKILEVVNKSKEFVLFCHESPDMDSIISCLVMKRILERMDKNVSIFTPDRISSELRDLDIKNEISYRKTANVNFSKFDVFVALDVDEFKRFGLNNNFDFHGVVINIDHHGDSLEGIGDVNIHDTKAGSTCTILYYMFKEWKIKLTKEDIDDMLLGVLSDTDIFHFSIYSSPFIFRTVAELLEKGADYETALLKADQSYSLGTMMFWAEGISRIKVDEKYRFAYTFIPNEVYKKHAQSDIRSRQLADGFLRKIDNTDFCIVMIEDKKRELTISVRTRTPKYYVLDLVKKLGGGGHLTGGGARVKADTTTKAIEVILKEARKYAKEHKK